MAQFTIDMQVSVYVEAESAKQADEMLREAGVTMVVDNPEHSGHFSDCYLESWEMSDEDDNPVDPDDENHNEDEED